MYLENFPSFLLNFSEGDMHGENGHIYEFSSFRLNVAERQLLDNGGAVSLTPKALDVLAVLVERAGHLVEKEELMQRVWPDSFVEEANVARIVHTLRKVLGKDQNGRKFIETVAKKGYRFVADVKVVSENGTISRSAAAFEGKDDKHAELPRYSAQIADTRYSSDVAPGTDTRRKTWPTSVLIAGTIFLVIVLAGGLFYSREEGPLKRAVKKVTPETFNGEALQNYEQGRFLVQRRHRGDYEMALEKFEKAIQLDPNYANAYAAIADVKVVRFWGSGAHEDISEARTAVRKAIELEPSNSYAHSLNCRILTTYDYDHGEAEKECRTAVELNPDDHEAQKEFAFLLSSLGRDSEAMSAIDKAVAIAPTSFNKRSRGMILYEFRRYDEAIEQFKQVEETDPLYKETTRWLIRAYEMKKDYPRALESYLSLLTQSEATPEEVSALKFAYEQSGWPAILRTMVDSPNLRTLFKAGTLSQLGEKDRAFETLEEMFKKRAVLLVTINQEPTLDPLRDDPRFEDLLTRIRLK